MHSFAPRQLIDIFSDAVFFFSDDSAPEAVTAAKFNASGRKLIVGFKSGGFKVYNFGNGQPLQEGFHCQGFGLGSLSTLGTFVIHSLANVRLQANVIQIFSIIFLTGRHPHDLRCWIWCHGWHMA
jgi:hypothetical protein